MRDLSASTADGTVVGTIASLPMWLLDDIESRLNAGLISFDAATDAAAIRERITIERTIRSLGYEAGWAS